MPLNHVMLDLETFGTSPGCVIRSVGAVFFDPETGQLGNEFYSNVEEKSCKKLKMFRDADTEKWWADPSRALANKMLANDPLPIAEIASRFGAFFCKGGRYLWSQGANFDEPLWSWVYRKLEMDQPWKFYDARDTRTAYDMARFNSRTITRAGTYHNALDDAKHQVVCVSAAYRRARGALV